MSDRIFLNALNCDIVKRDSHCSSFGAERKRTIRNWSAPLTVSPNSHEWKGSGLTGLDFSESE
jgi:hypothetical protein